MCPQGVSSHPARCSLALALSGRWVCLCLCTSGSSPAMGTCLSSGAQGLSQGLAEFAAGSTRLCCTEKVLGQRAVSSVLISQPLALCTGMVTRRGQKHQVSPLSLWCFLWDMFQVRVRACATACSRKHLGQDYTAIGFLWEPGSEPGLCRRWKAFPSGSCTPPSVICSDGAEGVSTRHGNFFLPVSSINLHAKTQTLWNAPALRRAPASHSTWHQTSPR